MKNTDELKRSCVKLDGEKIIPICYFCEKEVSEGDYCYGCKHYICEDCDKAGMDIGFGGHDVDEHQPEDEED